MPRVTEQEVRALFANFPENKPIDVFIVQANMLVDEVLSLSGLGESVLKEIERNIAAHYAQQVMQPATQSFSAGGRTVSREVNFARNDLSLASTRHGQRALDLDSTGLLAKSASSAKRRASITIGIGQDCAVH